VIVVADTSVLINLCRVGRGDLCRLLFHEVLIPPEVAVEFERLVSTGPRFAGLKLPDGVCCQPVTVVPALPLSTRGLDPGETAALALALEIHADAVLLDERRGHEVAVQLGLRTVGLLGLLLQAKTAGFLPAVQPVLDSLRREAGFWISDSVRQQVLRLAGEAN